VLQRQTQTAAFWRDQFEVTTDDLEFLYGLMLDAQSPKSLSELAVALVEERLRRENATIESELAKGEVYIPKETYQIGQTLVFPALEFAVGEVVEERPGHNPEHGDFTVIKVSFPDQEREFASGLQTEHRLNQTDGAAMDGDALLSAEEIYDLYQQEIDDALLYALEEGERSEDFVEVDGKWLLADMLTEVHVGHLNIAEALIELQGRPLSTEEMLADVELDENAPAAMQAISLNHALSQDQRFDPVTQDGRRLWYLKRLEPGVVAKTPPLLRYRPVNYNRSLLSVELLQVEWELDDEWGESGLTSDAPSLTPGVSLTLIYPHRKYGTLPLSARTRAFFPQQGGGLSLVTLVDGRWGAKFPGWVVHKGRYIAGLGKWMDDHKLPVGAYITLEQADEEDAIIVDYRTRRAKREWARIASADLDNMRLTFTMNKLQVACEYDDTLIVSAGDAEPLDELRIALERSGVTLDAIVEQIVPELTKLNPQGMVHAKSVYSAVNMIRRMPPGPVFYALISNRKFRDMGGGFFALA